MALDTTIVNKNILLTGEVVASKWKIVEKIGEGTFSQIYSAYAIEKGEKVAVKVEAPSALKPVLEWESMILRALQDCPYVCRYYYHGKHGESTVLIMELLGESMSMLRLTPDAIHGLPSSKCISVALEMLDCIEAFHRHGYVHRDIKASNFALSNSTNNSRKTKRYYIIDFGLSRQHLSPSDPTKVLPPRPVADFRGTSMYASLASHRRQELGPKDDLWSWFYLLLDFMRGELPWASDAQAKNRDFVERMKEFYTEENPALLVDGLPGEVSLCNIMKHLLSLTYSDTPNYKYLREQLNTIVEDQSKIWEVLRSDRERAILWQIKVHELLQQTVDDTDTSYVTKLETLLKIAQKYGTFFQCDGLTGDDYNGVQEVLYMLERKLRSIKGHISTKDNSLSSNLLLPPPSIQSFSNRRMNAQKTRLENLQTRRVRDIAIRKSIEIKIGLIKPASTEVPDVKSSSTTLPSATENVVAGKAIDSSPMDLSDQEQHNPSQDIIETITPRVQNESKFKHSNSYSNGYYSHQRRSPRRSHSRSRDRYRDRRRRRSRSRSQDSRGSDSRSSRRGYEKHNRYYRRSNDYSQDRRDRRSTSRSISPYQRRSSYTRSRHSRSPSRSRSRNLKVPYGTGNPVDRTNNPVLEHSNSSFDMNRPPSHTPTSVPITNGKLPQRRVSRWGPQKST